MKRAEPNAERLLSCDFCGEYESCDLHTNDSGGELRPMYELEDGCAICQKCLDEGKDKEDESQCERPCSPNRPCAECGEYWQRMVAEGYWDGERNQWTKKGLRYITRSS